MRPSERPAGSARMSGRVTACIAQLDKPLPRQQLTAQPRDAADVVPQAVARRAQSVDVPRSGSLDQIRHLSAQHVWVVRPSSFVACIPALAETCRRFLSRIGRNQPGDRPPTSPPAHPAVERIDVLPARCPSRSADARDVAPVHYLWGPYWRSRTVQRGSKVRGSNPFGRAHY